MSHYTAFLLPKDFQPDLLRQFPPAYSTVKADHITYEYGVQDFGNLFQPCDIAIYGLADSGDGLQALAVMVDGHIRRPDGNPFHITWSLEPHKYSAVDSNALIDSALRGTMSRGTFQRFNPCESIPAYPAVVKSFADGAKEVRPMPSPQTRHVAPTPF